MPRPGPIRPSACGLATLALAAVLLAGCVVVEVPRAGQPIEARAGKVLVYGRVRLFNGTEEYRPWAASSVLGPELHLWLLRLGPRRISPELPLEADGSFRWWLDAGDYALIGSRQEGPWSEVSNPGVPDFDVLSLLRVPEGALAAYAGELRVQALSVVRDEHMHTQYDLGPAEVRSDPEAARLALERAFGPLSQPPASAPLCAGELVPGFSDPDLATRGRTLLDRGCAER